MKLSPPTSSRALFIQRFGLLTMIIFCSIFFASRQLCFMCVLMLPLLYLLSNTAYPNTPSREYETINDNTEIREILDALPVSDQEPANTMSQLFSLVWPHIFVQERVDGFKARIQAALDATPIRYFSSIKLVSLEIGSRAPQITQVTLPKNLQPAKRSVIYRTSMLYYPEFKLVVRVSPRDVPSFDITFSDPTFELEWLTQFEFCPIPYIEGIPFLTATSVSLAKKPKIHYEFFKVTLFSSSLVNRDSIKKYMADRLTEAMWDTAGFPNALVSDNVRSTWKRDVIFKGETMQRMSASRGEMLRYSMIKINVRKFCETFKLPEPMTIRATAHRNQGTSTHGMTVIGNLAKQQNMKNICACTEEFMENPPTASELRGFIELSYTFLLDKFAETTDRALDMQRRDRGANVTGTLDDEFLTPLYRYVFFLNHQVKMNQALSTELDIPRRVEKLEKMIFAFHTKMSKLSA